MPRWNGCEADVSDMVDADQREWDILLEECKSLRTEILGKVENPYKIFGLVVTGIGTLLGIAVEFNVFTLALVLPLIIITSIFLIKSEERAIVNAADYIREVENTFIKNYPYLGWERWLKQNPAKKKKYVEFSVVSLTVLFVLYLGSIYLIIVFPKEAIDSRLIDPTFKYFAGLAYLLIGAVVLRYNLWD